MNAVRNPADPKNEEDEKLTRILATLIYASWGTYIFVILTGLYFQDWQVIGVTLAGCVLIFLPFVSLKRRKLHFSSLMLVFIELGTVTFIATVGQGIRDLAVVAYPIILVFAGLTLSRKYFVLCVGLTELAVFWLALGEFYGWFVTKPFAGGISNLFYLVGTSILMLVAALAVDLLAADMRKSLDMARNEIKQRALVEEQLRFQGTHDALTNIYNRAYFEAEIIRLKNSPKYPISIIMADVDNLKQTNDTQGHTLGDEILRKVAEILRSVFRTEDVLARIGGDEFAVLLPGANSDQTERILLRIHAQLKEHNAGHPNLPIHLSLGAATTHDDNLTETFKLADQRMYAEKAAHKPTYN
jgi:diguanylate cyclase (GGDEF)-like protein